MSPETYISGGPDPGATGRDDAYLVTRVRAGDESAFAALYDRYARLVLGVAVRVLRDRAAAEDLLQEIFLQLWKQPQAFDSARGALAPWLTVITRNRAIDRIRRRPAQSDIADVELSFDSGIENATAQAQLLSRAKAVLSELPAAQQKAIEMAYFEGLTHAEIAAQTGEPLGTIKGRIRGAIAALAKVLTQ
ncbi:MAG TPA: sigma-70 family RNA polymerase sigma factor [Terriglobales bacterium]|jgi:RNA polymerase sigma-70 factor (ECF subfamily)|nr:sigma-70 family RNA polymerase sigma factor [Terriglobales bacterium]